MGLLAVWVLTGCSGGASSGETCAGQACTPDTEDTDDGYDESDDADGQTAGKDAGKSSRDAGVSGGKSDAGSASGDKSKGLPCDVQTILESRCATCHGEEPSFGAPQSLVSASDFQASKGSTKMHALVKERINTSDTKKRMPPASSPKLTTAELATLNAWLDKGATASDASCSGKPDTSTDAGTKPVASTENLECYKFTAHAGDRKTPYKVGVANDAYFNFTFDPPWKGTVYGVLFRPIIDNKAVIHHWLLFQDSLRAPATGAVPSIGAHPAGQLLHGWAPGGEVLDFRTAAPGTTVALPLPETSYTVEFHYNSTNPGAVDASGVEVCVTREKPANEAGLSWLGVDQLLLPSTKWTGTCRPASNQPIHLIGVTPHMHKTGTHMKAVINRANGQKEVLHDEPFDFEFQRSYNKEGITLMPGDSITTECTYSRPMAFGESTNAEMCYLFTMAYPKGALADFGLWGAFAHGGSSCLGQ